MNGILSANQVIVYNLLDPGSVLYASLFVLFGAAVTLVFLLKERPALSWPLMSLLVVIECIFAGILALEFSAASNVRYTFETFTRLSDALSTHRWLLFQMPAIVLAASIIVLATYRDHIAQKHARYYRGFVILSVFISFCAILVIGIESLV